jgi:hypothetical protein
MDQDYASPDANSDTDQKGHCGRVGLGGYRGWRLRDSPYLSRACLNVG